MSTRPDFYSGRGATTTDLNFKKLDRIADAIQKNLGKKAVKSFVKMVADIPKLTTTDFLLNLARLESANWKWSKKLLGPENGLYPDNPDSATATVVAVLAHDFDRDETIAIRSEFLKKYGIKESRLIPRTLSFWI